MKNPRVAVPALLVYGLGIVLANWLIRHVGPIVVPGGNHFIPVGFGLIAPSGALAAGLTFVARDVVQRFAGKKWALVIIPLGILITWLITDASLAFASAAAFACSETADYLIYTPLQQRMFVLAVLISGLGASVIDSVVFLPLAGLPASAALHALPGLILAKAYVQIVCVPVALYLRKVLPAQNPKLALATWR